MLHLTDIKKLFSGIVILILCIGSLVQKNLSWELKKISVLMASANEVIIWSDYRVDKWQGTARDLFISLSAAANARERRAIRAGRPLRLSPRRDNSNQLDSHAGSERARTQPGAAFYFALKPVFMPRVSMANMIRTHSRYFFALAQQATESL